MKEKLGKISQFIKSFFQKLGNGIKNKPIFFEKTTAVFAVLWEKIKLFLKSGVDFTPPAKEKIVSFVLKWWHWTLGSIFAFIVLYFLFILCYNSGRE